MSSNQDFFLSPQAAAIYKHKVLKSYIPAWAGKVGSTSQGRRVVVYDAYSGPGRYTDAQPGSPELLVDTAEAMAKLRSVHTIFSDKEADYCDRLEQLLAEKGIDRATYEVRRGPVETHVEGVLAVAGELPLFVFLDPYGLTVPFERVVHILKSRDKTGYSQLLQPKTELLMNFSYEAVRRISGALRSEKEYSAKAAQIAALDTALGGAWWQPIAWEQADDWVDQVLAGYANRVREAAGGGGYITVSVADSLEAKPVYELILFTRHPDGLWEMATAMSYARKEWRQWLVDRRQEAAGGQAELRGLDFDDNEDAWVTEIAANVEAILGGLQSFVIQDQLGEVLGRTLGLARETHMRKALKLLVERQVVRDVPKGGLQRAVVRRK
jgi:three-Cys-motif partner protein